jgi:hypothetical protein
VAIACSGITGHPRRGSQFRAADPFIHARSFLNTKTRHFALRFAPAHLFLYPSATAPQLGRRIEHEEDDVGLVDDSDFVQHADVVSPLLFLRLVGSCRRRVGRDRRDVISPCGLCEQGQCLHLEELVGGDRDGECTINDRYRNDEADIHNVYVAFPHCKP